ncbi:LytR C-terminal domain-containing protein [Rhodococcus sp. NPDC058521]|uniref:LytR C-terminal domain-containing protein n=1 Tax=Rhodococcus sp. NPDC058521 TaxID=3346536 RepID=UPI00365F1BC2
MSTQKPDSSGPPLRALAMVLIALAILFAGIGFASLGSSDTQEASPSLPATTTTSAAAGAGANSARATTTPRASGSDRAAAGGLDATTTTTSGASTSITQADKDAISVRVLNNSNVQGLAGNTANELTGSGWTVAETGNYSEGTISKTTVYYGTGAAEKQAATEIASELGVTAEPRFPGIADSTPGVIVIVTEDG